MALGIQVKSSHDQLVDCKILESESFHHGSYIYKYSTEHMIFKPLFDYAEIKIIAKLRSQHDYHVDKKHWLVPIYMTIWCFMLIIYHQCLHLNLMVGLTGN